MAALLVALLGDGVRARKGTTVRLVDVAAQAGLDLVNVSGGAAKDFIVDANGNGAAFFDYDNDGDLDALIVNGSTRERIARGGDPMVALYRNDGSGRFTDVTAASGFTPARLGIGRLRRRLRQRRRRRTSTSPRSARTCCGATTASGTFTDVTRRAGIDDTRWGTSCAFADYDRDGDLDLYVANYVKFDDRRSPRAARPPTAVSWRPTSSAARSG